MPNMAKFSVLFGCSGGKVSLTGQFTILLSVVEEKESNLKGRACFSDIWGAQWVIVESWKRNCCFRVLDALMQVGTW